MDAVAQEWAEEMARTDVLAHRPQLAPYTGEIIASGADTPETAMRLWMTSPPHREIIFNTTYGKIGIGYSAGYWCVVFN